MVIHEPIAGGFYEKTTSNCKKVFDGSYKNAIAKIKLTFRVAQPCNKVQSFNIVGGCLVSKVLCVVYGNGKVAKGYSARCDKSMRHLQQMRF
ncbi:hypothetical protein A6769_33390 [Nostoc punctiforme NIES-2108]|uniref:Uncharacterized protein n=1 Tax=Nostoc punctiforme NIES-2108 TaxID=1356359 RepID=A0A367R2Q0_NOSPU|nr:hypothetical protein A6769_33390 [Nostoc punctiforme NIES-2108]